MIDRTDKSIYIFLEILKSCSLKRQKNVIIRGGQGKDINEKIRYCNFENNTWNWKSFKITLLSNLCSYCWPKISEVALETKGQNE